jgi:cytochrome c biogenesis protein CcmG/thiol:disulfide interchange protein DsbE
MKEEPHKTSRGPLKSIGIFALIIIAVFGVAILLTRKDSSIDPPKQSHPATRRPAPDFTLSGLDGKTVRLTDYKGKVVLLNIWATWCPSCVEEMPSMEKLYKELKGENFEILGVSIDESGAKVVVPFMQKYNLSFPTLVDPGGRAVQGLYRITGVPESFLVDKEGNIAQVIIGPTDWATPEAIGYFKHLIQEPRQPR